ncbi:hypothetical protein CDL15_Pgr013563 [Punica granatum]|uniref:Uncharacterized protein n=1 Tax=Punica granatum TaxID=22663 RepID=A0A218W121_PUNGR|nr:hypothetical protein CDL15_Pgr013563 [Punica granatum]
MTGLQEAREILSFCNDRSTGKRFAILASDALSALAIEHFAGETKSKSPAQTVRALREIARFIGAESIMAGKEADISSEGMLDEGLKELEFINWHKTETLFEASGHAWGNHGRWVRQGD